ncbi:MAG: hypothetical protein WCY80_01540 [Candidatus Izemoplasmatales bacterium]
MKNRLKIKFNLTNIILIVLIVISLTLALIDAFRSVIILENNVTNEVYSIFKVESIALAITLWLGIIIIFSLVYLLIAKKISVKKINKNNKDNSDIVFSSGNEERNVSACDYRKWSK